MTDTLRPVDTAVPETASSSPKTLKRSIGVVGGTLLTLSCVTPASTLFVVLEVIAAAVVAVLGFAHSRRGAGSLVSMQVAGSGGHTDTVTAMLVVSGLAIALFVTQGFSTAVYLSEELEHPRRNVARTV